MKIILHIIKYKLKSIYREKSQTEPKEIFKSLASTLVYVIFAVGAFVFSIRALEFLLEYAKIGKFLLHEFISIILFIFFMAINVGNIIVSYSTLYKSNEIDFIFTKPIKPSYIFLIKFLDNFFYSSSTLILIFLSIFAGYVIYFEVSIFNIMVLVFGNFFPFFISAGSLGVIVLLLLLKIISNIGVRTTFGILISAYLIIIYNVYEIYSPVELVGFVLSNLQNVDSYMGQFYFNSFVYYLPNRWISETMYWMLNENMKEVYSYTFYQIILAVSLFSTALFLGNKWYYKTWLINQGVKNIEKKKNNKPIKNSFLSASKSGNIIYTVRKEFILFFREPSQILHFSLLCFLIIIFVSSLSGLDILEVYNPNILVILYLVILLFNSFLLATFSLRFIYPILSLEGKNFWKLKTAPINQNKLLLIKVLPFSLIIIVIGQLLNLFANIRNTTELIPITALIMLLVSVTFIFINYGMGSLYAKYNEKNPIRISSSQGASLSFLFTLAYLVVVIALLIKPFHNFFMAKKGLEVFINSNLNLSLLIILIISLTIIITFYRMIMSFNKKDY